MAETTRFTIGANARCSDGDCGTVVRVVVDPVAEAVTHLVVEPKHRSGLGKLVPLDLVERVDAASSEVRLGCTLDDFGKLDPAEETDFLPGNNGRYGGYSPGEMVVLPHFRLSEVNIAGSAAYDLGNAFLPSVSDTIPAGEVEVRRGEQVRATDGDIGHVEGLVIDPRNHHVTHLLLKEGHLWGRKQVAIPISAVSRLGDMILLNLAKQEVQDLPPVAVDSPSG